MRQYPHGEIAQGRGLKFGDANEALACMARMPNFVRALLEDAAVFKVDGA